MHLNAQSIHNKFDVLRKELHGQGIGILLFSETWLTEMNADTDYPSERRIIICTDGIAREI